MKRKERETEADLRKLNIALKKELKTLNAEMWRVAKDAVKEVEAQRQDQVRVLKDEVAGLKKKCSQSKSKAKMSLEKEETATKQATLYMNDAIAFRVLMVPALKT